MLTCDGYLDTTFYYTIYESMRKLLRFLICIVLITCAKASSGQILNRQPVPQIDGRGKTIILTFDDASRSHYDIVMPMLKKYGFGATFYVCEFPPDFKDSSKYMTWHQIAGLSKSGYEIGNHSWHHMLMTGLTDSVMESEVTYIEQQCQKYKAPKPTSFCYPGYVVDSSIFPILKRHGYLTARTGGDRPWDPRKDNPYLVPCYTIKGNDPAYFYNALTKATGDNVIVFCIHGVPDTAHDFVSTPPEVFADYLKYLHDHHFKVLSMHSYSIGLKQ